VWASVWQESAVLRQILRVGLPQWALRSSVHQKLPHTGRCAEEGSKEGLVVTGHLHKASKKKKSPPPPPPRSLFRLALFFFFPGTSFCCSGCASSQQVGMRGRDLW
jgi:hypothetical protein